MCGFAGFTGYLENGKDVLTNMMNKIIHRGPDSAGQYIDDKAYMGFRRLSIIDLDNGSQPMFNENKKIVITFNGEIYNYQDLRKELIEKGHIFANNSDTEVLIHAYEEYGEDMLNKLRGMFAFVIWDSEKETLFGARDFFGIKPFYYTVVDGNIIYGSEIKSILAHPAYKKEVNDVALENYLTFQYSVLPETFFKGVYKLMPGHCFTFHNGEINIKRYWEPTFEADENKSLDEFVQEIDDAMHDSVEHHKISDVEVGSFLSSGVDSSYVSTYFADQKTFTVGFDFGEKYNEISWAKNLSEKIGVEHHTHLISSEEFWDAVPTVQYHMDQPLADPSCIALYFVSRLASHYVKVVLSGEGADELFGGYTCYNDPRVFKIYQTIVPHCIRKAIRAICRKLPDIKGRDYLIRACDKLEERYIGNAFMYDYKQKQELLKDPSIATRPQDLTRKYYYRCRKYDDVTKMQYLDINMWMVGDILLKADRMSMANSLELRVPFLDKEVFKVASSLPTKLRCNKHNTKYAMRKAAVRHMPEATAEKEKLGFPVPTRVWLRDEKYYNVVKTKFKGKTAEKFFNTDVLVSWLDSHFSGKEDNSRRVWTIYVFLVWYDIYFDEDSEKVEKPVNHLDELKAVAEARREKQIDAPGEVIMAAAEEIDENYDAPNFGVDKSKKNDESAEKAEEPVKEESAEDVTEKVEVPDDGNEPAIVEPEEEPEVKEEPKKEEYVNISNPEDNEIYDAPKKPSTPQEQMQMAIDSIEKRSKYLDEPNVISDEAVDNIVNSISFFDDEDDKN